MFSTVNNLLHAINRSINNCILNENTEVKIFQPCSQITTLIKEVKTAFKQKITKFHFINQF